MTFKVLHLDLFLYYIVFIVFTVKINVNVYAHEATQSIRKTF